MGETMSNLRTILVAVATASAILSAASANAQEAKHYRFAYDQPKTTGYGILGDIFADKLKELSKGTMLIDQYPGAQLGQDLLADHLDRGRPLAEDPGGIDDAHHRNE